MQQILQFLSGKKRLLITQLEYLEKKQRVYSMTENYRTLPKSAQDLKNYDRLDPSYFYVPFIGYIIIIVGIFFMIYSVK